MALLLRPPLKAILKTPVCATIALRRSQSNDYQPNVGNVSGLSSKVVAVPTEEVGPGASKASSYKNPEYFCYHNVSYFEAEVEMSKYRMPQPSSKPPELYRK